MSNLRQKERHAKLQNEQQITSRLLEQTNKKLDTLIELFKLQSEQIKNIPVHTIITETKTVVQNLEEQLGNKQSPDFIPSIDTTGMKTKSKEIEVKKRRRDLNSNLKKLQDIHKENGGNDNACG